MPLPEGGATSKFWQSHDENLPTSSIDCNACPNASEGGKGELLDCRNQISDCRFEDCAGTPTFNLQSEIINLQSPHLPIT
jgi:hypothetical protein